MIGRAFQNAVISPQRLAAESTDGRDRNRTLLVMPAIRPGSLAVVKVVTVLRGGEGGLSSHLLALDRDGTPLALIAAHQLTARRTAAASVLATRTLRARPARHLAVLGAGRQARAQIEAYADAMPLETVTLWARRTAAAEELASACVSQAPRVQIARTSDDAVRRADIVTCLTASEAPLFSGESVSPGAHVDLVGGFRPTMREADDSLMRRATIVADTPAAVEEAGDLVQPLASQAIQRGDISFLADLLAGKAPVRHGDITVFKSVGFAAQDLVVAELLLQRLELATSAVTPPEAFPTHSQGMTQ